MNIPLTPKERSKIKDKTLIPAIEECLINMASGYKRRANFPTKALAAAANIYQERIHAGVYPGTFRTAPGVPVPKVQKLPKKHRADVIEFPGKS